jgi:hypothetical protein
MPSFDTKLHPINFDFTSLYPRSQTVINVSMIRNQVRIKKIKKILFKINENNNV